MDIPLSISSTHKNPQQNLHTTSISKFIATLERRLEKNARINDGTMIVLRPFSSARKPQKCELTMIPIAVIPDNTPLCWVVSERSHSATGNTKLIPTSTIKRIFMFIQYILSISVTNQSSHMLLL